MDYEFTSQKDFKEALEEVDILIKLADEHAEDDIKYSLFLKSGILFLATKFETFVEDTISEYVHKICRLKLKVSQLPDDILLSALNYHLTDEFINLLRQRNNKVYSQINCLTPFFKDNEVIEQINIDHKFSYGRHGAKLIEKLFERIGHYDIFNQCKICISNESMLSDEPLLSYINLSGQINALTGIRNGIIHENKSPNLSVQQITEYRDNITSFVHLLSIMLKSELNQLSEGGANTTAVIQ